MVKIFVEGGGNSNASLTAQCRKAFSKFFEKAGLKGKLPRIVPCGGRRIAYDDFCVAIKNKESAFLLVDSECLVKEKIEKTEKSFIASPWDHLRYRVDDKWSIPDGATNEHCHLMVTSMETWFLADVSNLTAYFGNGFNANQLPANIDLEEIDCHMVATGIDNAAKNTPKKGYNKGRDSFKILEIIDPKLVTFKSIWAERLIDTLKNKC